MDLNVDLNIYEILAAFGLSAVIAFAFTPISIKLAHLIGAIDVPKDWRRMHRRPIPRFGGLAIFTGVMVALAIFQWDEPKIRVAMLGGALMYLLGVVDDLKNLPAIVKLIGQTVIAILMFSMNMRISFIANYLGEGRLHFNTAICFVVTVLWIIGITNTINIIDGLDGLAAGISAIAALCIAYIAYIHGSIVGMPIVCLAMVTIAGSCIGFLPFNFSPAKTFMGDGGALFLGFMIAILSVVGPLKRSTIIAVVVPVVVLAIPIFDTSFAILRRMVNRKPIMGADKEHLHHRLMAYGYGQRRTVIMLYGISAIMGTVASLIVERVIVEAAVLTIIAMLLVCVFIADHSSLKEIMREGLPGHEDEINTENNIKKADE